MCTVVGIAGASGSGKTFFANKLAEQLRAEFGRGRVAVIQEDFYYKDQSAVPLEERAHTNYDHPDSLDHGLMCRHLSELKAGRAVELPQYDYHHHTRASQTVHMEPTRVILVEGILLFSDERLRRQFNVLLFIDTPLDICLLRRMRRDVKERGRTFDSVMGQYMSTVRPMYFAFIEPSKQHADVLVPGSESVAVAIDLVKARLEKVLREDEASPSKL